MLQHISVPSFTEHTNVRLHDRERVCVCVCLRVFCVGSVCVCVRLRLCLTVFWGCVRCASTCLHLCLVYVQVLGLDNMKRASG